MAGMAFNSTSSKLEHTTQSGFDVAQLTICAWFRANSAGESNFGRLICADENNNGFHVRRDIAAGPTHVILFTYNFSVLLGAWHVTSALNAYQAFSVIYDRGATTNDPVFRINYAAPSVTELSTPNGTPTSPNTGYCIGNRSAQDRTWDGGIMHLQFHPTLLSAADQDKANKWPGSVHTAGAMWWPMLNGTYTEIWTSDGTTWSRGTDPTATDISTFTTSSPTCAPVDSMSLATV